MGHYEDYIFFIMAININSPFYKPPIRSYSEKSIPQQRTKEPKAEKTHNYLNFIADRGGCGHWRVLFPEQHINLSGMGSSMSIHKMIFEDSWYADVDAIKLQRQVSTKQLKFVEYLKSIQAEMDFKLIYEVDDIMLREDIPDYNGFKSSFDNDELRQNAIDAINLCDEMTVVSPFMKEYFKGKTGKEEITVVENYMPQGWFGNLYNANVVKRNFQKHKDKPRIIYAGSTSHFDIRSQNGHVDDFTHVNKFVIDNIDKYKFVFIGAYPIQLRSYVQSGRIEYHPWKNLQEFPEFVSKLEAQAFIAPLQDNNFNKAKSNIKFLESAALGIPCFCQDLCTYDIAPNFLKFNTGEDLAERLDVVLNPKNVKKYVKLSKELRSISEDYFLERPENIGKITEVYDTPYGDPSRKYATY